jgi:Domain of unknown function (DUF303).
MKNVRSKTIALTVLALFICCFYTLGENLSLARLFSDNMVLQQGIPVQIWGKAAPNERIQIRLGNKKGTVKTGADGKWRLSLPAFDYGGPYALEVKGSKQTLKYENIMIGEVWLASGQSNMNFAINRPISNMEKVVEEANYPMIREFAVPLRVGKAPLDDFKKGEWKVCNPQNVPEFSAVAYFFARSLYLKKKVAIGIIHVSWSGSRIEAWISKDALLSYPEVKDKVVDAYNDTTDWAKMQFLCDRTDTIRNVIVKNAHNGMDQEVYKPEYEDSTWKSSDYPIKGWKLKAPSYSLIWLRKNFDMPTRTMDKDYVLHLGRVLESDITYINGVEVGRSSQLDQTEYKIPHDLLKPGKNVITIRLYDAWGSGQIGSQADEAYMQSEDKTVKVSLGGQWKYNMDIEPRLPVGKSYSNMPTGLFNAMINPLIPYGIKGFLWYQGESNADSYEQYKTLQPLLIKDWRTRWGKENLSFLFVQLPNLKGSTSWPWMREAQAQSLQIPYTGMAVSIDLGDPYDVHPHQKQPVAERLALLATHLAYGEDVVCSGPVFSQYRLDGNSVVVSFINTDGGLVLKDSLQNTGFVVAGADKQFHPAEVLVRGKELVIKSPMVDKPVAVRYAWEADPCVTLYNGKGLPATPFRTDDWVFEKSK